MSLWFNELAMVKLRDNGPPPTAPPEKAERLSSLDAMRGTILLLLIGGGFGLKEILRDERWRWITRQFSATEWTGCTLWDLLCPALLFVVGVALPYSYTNRQAKGHLWIRQFGHAIVRAAVLIALGIYLDSYFAKPTPHLVLDLRGELQQIGLAYLIAFLVVGLGMVVHSLTIAFLLIGQTAACVIYAFASGSPLWQRDVNLGIAIDQWLHFEPREPATLNVIAATAIVLAGMLTAGVVRSSLAAGAKAAITTGASFLFILLGWILSGGGGVAPEWFAIIPMIAKLGTLTYVFTAVGWNLLIFTYFYLIMDGLLLRFWAMPLAVFGRNSLLLFLVFTFSHGWAVTSATLVLPSSPPLALTLQPLFVTLIVIAIYWLLCFLLYRRRIFVKV